MGQSAGRAAERTDLIGGLAAIVPTFAGLLIGKKIRDAVSPETFRTIFLVGLLGIGVHMALDLL